MSLETERDQQSRAIGGDSGREGGRARGVSRPQGQWGVCRGERQVSGREGGRTCLQGKSAVSVTPQDGGVEGRGEAAQDGGHLDSARAPRPWRGTGKSATPT